MTLSTVFDHYDKKIQVLASASKSTDFGLGLEGHHFWPWPWSFWPQRSLALKMLPLNWSQGKLLGEGNPDWLIDDELIVSK